MKFTYVVAVLALFGVATTEALTISNKIDQAKVTKLFSGFVSKFQRNYKNNNEYNTRLSNFMKNFQIVEENNANGGDFTLEANKFADLTNAEYQSMMGLRADLADDDEIAVNAEQFEYDLSEQSSYPTSLDWRSSNVVATIKNQGSCGGCYSFSALEALQSYYHIKKGKASSAANVINLSEQQVIDCSASYGNNGCNGGLMTSSYNYLKAYPIMTEADYPYVGKKNTCKYSSAKGQFKVTSYVSLPKNDANALMAAVQKQPITIGIAASSSTFQLYKSGVISTTACGTTVNHAVNLIGYGSTGGVDYWLLKNSWGTSWGEAGYFKVKRTTSGTSICNMLTLSSYPTGISV